MMKTSPNPIDVQDFQFKLLCKLKVFDNSNIEPFSKKCSLVASASQYGLLFVGSKTTFQVIRCVDLEQLSVKDGEKEDYVRRVVQVNSTVTHLCANCDGSLLAVVAETNSRPIAQFYDVRSLFTNEIKIVNRLQLSPTPGTSVVEIGWNPTNPEMFTACKSDGSLGVYEIKKDVIITELPPGACAVCFSWSPKGKQIAVGSRDGKITQYKPADMKAARVINPPPISNSHITALQWVSSFQFVGVYVSCQDEDTRCHVVVVDAPKTGETTYIDYDDICFSNTPVRPIQFYLMLQPQWSILMVSSSNSMEVAVLHQTGETWMQLTLIDSARAELPLSRDRSDTLPIGFALDTSSTQPLPWGEGTIPPTPRIFLLSHYGVLCCFNVVNFKENIPSICEAPRQVGEIMPSVFTKGESTAANKLIENPQPHTEPLPTAVMKSAIETKTTVTSTAPITQGSSIFTSIDTQNTLQSKSNQSLFKSQSSIQPIGQNNKIQFTNLPPSNEGHQNIPGNIQPSIQINKVAFGHDQQQSTNQHNKVTFATTPVSLEDKGGTMYTFSNTTVQDPQQNFANIHQSNAVTVTPETPKSATLASYSLKQSTSVQNMQRFTESSLIPGSIIPKPQAVFSQNLKADVSIASNETGLEEDTKISDDELNELLARMIQEECVALESELKAILHQAKTVNIAVGADNEKVNLVQLTTILEEFLNEVVNNNAVQKSDVHVLKQNLIQTWAWLEEAKSRHYTANDSTIVAILRAQPLDSAAEKQLQHIKHLMYYLESQLKQAHDALDDQWESFQNYCRKTCKMQLPTMEAIFQAMLKHNGIFQKLTYKVKDITAKIKSRDQLKLKSPSLVDLDSLRKIELEMNTLSIQPQDIYKLQYERILSKNKLMSPNKTQKLRKYLKQTDVKRILSFKATVPEPKLQTLRESNSFMLGTDSFKNISQIKVPAVTKIDPMKCTLANPTSSSTPLSLQTKEKLPQSSSFTKPLSFGSAFVPTSISSGSFDVSSASTPFKNVSALSSGKAPVFKIPSTVTPVTTSSLFGLTSVAKPVTNKVLPASQLQEGISSQGSSGFTPQTTLSYSIDQTKSLAFEYPNPVNPDSSVIVIDASNLPKTSTPKTYGFKMPTDEISITKMPSTQATKSVFNLPKDIEIIKADANSIASTRTNKNISDGVTTNSIFQTSSTSNNTIKPNLGDVSSSTVITFKRGEVPIVSKDTHCTTIHSGVTKAVTASQLSQPLAVHTVSTVSSGTTNLFSQSSNEAAPSTTAFKLTSTPSQPTQSIFGGNKVTTTSSTPATRTTVPQVSTTSFSTLFSTTSQSYKNSPSSTNIFLPSSTTTKSDTKSTGSVFSTNVTSSSTSNSIFSSTSVAKTHQSQSTTQASSVLTTSKSTVDTTVKTADEYAPATKSVFGSVPQQISKLFGGSTSIAATSPTDSNIDSVRTTTSVSTEANIFAAAAATAASKSTKETEKAADIQAVKVDTSAASPAATSQSVTVSTTQKSIFGTVQPSLTESSSTQGSIFATSAPSTSGNIFGGASNTTTSASIFGGFGMGTSTNSTSTSSIFGTTVSSVSTLAVTKATTSSIFGASPATTTTTGTFGGTTASSAVPTLFGGASSTSAFGSTPSNTTQSVFGVPSVASSASPFATTSTSVFGSSVSTSTTVPFGTVTITSSDSPFSSAGKSIFGNPSAFASTSSSAFSGQSSGNIFGTPSNTSGTTSATNVFATQSSGFGTFGNATTTQSFQQPSPFGNVFGGSPAASSVPASGATVFGTSSSQFGTTSSTSGNLFGTPTPLSNASGFASSASNAPSFGFGGLSVGGTTTSSQFGSTEANPFAKSSSIFGGTPSTQSSIFGGATQSTQSSSIFGSATPASQSSSIFGGSSAFGSTSSAQGAFGGAPSFGGSPAFGQQPTFGQSTFSTSPQPGPFSGGSSSIAQTGFGTPPAAQKPGGFGSSPAFGSGPSFGSAPSFGGAPTFGSSPSFSSPGKMFGGGASVGGFQAAPTQENPTFANLANQNTVGFGSLAQQTQDPSAQFSANSSFSSWR